MLDFTIYGADCVGNSGNCLYPNKMVGTDKVFFIVAKKMEHVTTKYKGNYRSKDNFEFSDRIPLECDSDHSENPEEWLTPFDIVQSSKEASLKIWQNWKVHIKAVKKRAKSSQSMKCCRRSLLFGVRIL